MGLGLRRRNRRNRISGAGPVPLHLQVRNTDDDSIVCQKLLLYETDAGPLLWSVAVGSLREQ
jgi:hypothetical protein